MAGVERTIRPGSMVYIDADGRRRRADHGAVVQVHPDHLERFDRLNVLQGQAQEAAPAESVAAPKPEPKPRTATRRSKES
ncbi:hypothetical protein [Nocardia puris]|uniref:hypothetical protein n=1 Tax=Nocardia puris TaxID=208602 RepID=UPI0018944929|nr:hypothetical protein [Nocardia puris]